MDFVLGVFLSGDKSGLGQTLVVTRDFDLLAVFCHFFHSVVERFEFLELLLEFVFHLHSDLIGAFGDDAHGFVDVAGIGRKLDHVTGDSVERCICLFVVHIIFTTDNQFLT